MCASEKDAHTKLPYILIDSNRRDDLPAIHLNHASDASLPSSPGSPAQFSTPTSPTSKQKSSFFQSRKKQISLQPKLLMPTASLERSISDCDPARRPTSACSDQPMTAPVLNERNQKARASIAFDFNILHYLTKGHYFSNNNGESKTAGFFFGGGRSKNKIKFNESERNEKHSESGGSLISLIQRREPNGKKKKKKKKKSSKELSRDESSDREPEVIAGSSKSTSNGTSQSNSKGTSKSTSSIKISSKSISSKKKSRKVLADQSNQQSSSSSSSLLSLNNLSSSIEKLTSKFKKERKSREAFDDAEQLLHKYGRVIVPGEPHSFRSMMQWSPARSSLPAGDSNSSKSDLPAFTFTQRLPPTNPSLKSFRKEYAFGRQTTGHQAPNPQQYDKPNHLRQTDEGSDHKQTDHKHSECLKLDQQSDHPKPDHHHHSKNCHHTHQHHCSNSTGKQRPACLSERPPSERTLPERTQSERISFGRIPSGRAQSENRKPEKQTAADSILERHCLEKQQLMKETQQNQSNKFSFFKNKILRSRSFDTPKSSKYQVSACHSKHF